jgi:hypothetical protein
MGFGWDSVDSAIRRRIHRARIPPQREIAGSAFPCPSPTRSAAEDRREAEDTEAVAGSVTPDRADVDEFWASFKAGY